MLWKQKHHPPVPLAPIRMHAAPGLVALNDKTSFWLQLKSAGLEHLAPHTILLEECYPTGVQQTLNAKVTSTKHLWFLKYRRGDNGSHVGCFTKPELLEEHVNTFRLDNCARLWLIQEGVRPLLVNGRKPVLRNFVLVVGRKVYIHREFLLKCLGGEYSEDTDDRRAHVCCESGDPGVSVTRGSEWQEYARLFPRICEAAGRIMAAYSDVLEPDPSMDGCRYSLIGLDTLIAQDGLPKVLEANCPPALFEVCDELTKEVKIEVQEDFYRFVVVGLGIDEEQRGGFLPLSV